uniref:hypothetical protein n=1 Tax=Corallococcus coralloides TaxID=184914 RepID=UPI000FFE3828|nr:hypothetical protein [Corallococcus coralloides]
MPKVILDVPEEVAEKLRAMEAKLKATAAAAREGAAELDVDSALAAVDEAVDATALEMKRRVLQGLDTDALRLLIDGGLHARVGRYTATTSAGTLPPAGRAPRRSPRPGPPSASPSAP